MEPVIIVHSGAGFFPDYKNEEKFDITKKAATAGYECLMHGDNPLDAVERAVRVMEDHPSCNAGHGSVLTDAGQVEMDAMIIRGCDLASGGVGALKHVRNPISVARAVMEKTDFVLLAGQGAEDFAKSQAFHIVPNSELVTPQATAQLQAVLAKTAAASTETAELYAPKESGLGTVGAVAMNSRGELAAATSTGGICGKLPGRIGDTPIPGGGTFCDDESCGISATGLGESIMRACLSSRIANLIENGMECSEACLTALRHMSSRVKKGDGGAIVITNKGQVGHAHNSRKMTWAWIRGHELHFGLQEGQDFVEECKPVQH